MSACQFGCFSERSRALNVRLLLCRGRHGPPRNTGLVGRPYVFCRVLHYDKGVEDDAAPLHFADNILRLVTAEFSRIARNHDEFATRALAVSQTLRYLDDAVHEVRAAAMSRSDTSDSCFEQSYLAGVIDQNNRTLAEANHGDLVTAITHRSHKIKEPSTEVGDQSLRILTCVDQDRNVERFDGSIHPQHTTIDVVLTDSYVLRGDVGHRTSGTVEDAGVHDPFDGLAQSRKSHGIQGDK